MRYIQMNRPHVLSFMLFDLDFPESSFAFEKHDLPMPTWIVINRGNGHCHYIYALRTPVTFPVANQGNERPRQYFTAIEHTYRTLLNADPAYSGLTVKNPCHDHWLVIFTPVAMYELGKMADYVDIQKPPRKKERQAGQGRNVALFDELRFWAYKAVRKHSDYDEWHNDCLSMCASMNVFDNPLPFSEIQSIAKSVARWVWEHMGPESPNTIAFKARQSKRSRQGLLARVAKNEDKRASARLLCAQGKTIREIAEELGVSKSSVAKWIKIDMNRTVIS